jgi:hypothetical protein
LIYDPGQPFYTKNNELNLTAWHVAQVMSTLRDYLDVAAICDFPVPDLKNPARQEMQFRRHYGYNLTAARELLELRRRHTPEIGLYFPLQTYTFAHFNTAMADLGSGKDHTPFEGFCLPVRIFDDPAKIGVWALKILLSTSVVNLHIFGTHAFFAIALCAGLSGLFSALSLDSSSYFHYAKHSLYLLNDLQYVLIEEGKAYSDAISSACGCPVCAHVTLNDLRFKEPKYRSKLLEIHNYVAIDNFFKYAYRHSGSPHQLRQALLRISTRGREIDLVYNTLCAIEAFRNVDVSDEFLDRLYMDLIGRKRQ